MASIEPTELKALITLLDDQDAEVFYHVQERLRGYGSEIVPHLMEAWEGTPNLVLQDRIEYVIHHIQLEQSLNAFEHWIQTPELDLLSGALIIAQHRYPDFNEHLIWNRVDQLKRDIWVEMRGFTSPIEKINLFNHVFYRQWAFTVRAVEEDVEGHDFFLNRVVESRKGNELTIGMLYLAMARQLGLPVYGVILPDNFCLAYCRQELDEDRLLWGKEELQRGIQFFINPANKGLIFTRHELREHLKKIDQADLYDDIGPVTTLAVIELLVTTMQLYYRKHHKPDLADDMNAYLRLLH